MGQPDRELHRDRPRRQDRLQRGAGGVQQGPARHLDASGSDTPAERRAIVEEYLANNIVPIVEDHAVTNETYVNDPNGLHQVVTNWLDPANVSWLQQYERQVILNIANEWGPPATSSESRLARQLHHAGAAAARRRTSTT